MIDKKAKQKAVRKIANEIKQGRLIRPKECSECGREHRRIHGHHEDYEKPLEVIWLCPPCHFARHMTPEQIHLKEWVEE